MRMSTIGIGILFALTLVVNTTPLAQFHTVGADAPDPLERSAAMGRSFGHNIHSIRTPLKDFENTCTLHCMKLLNKQIIRYKISTVHCTVLICTLRTSKMHSKIHLLHAQLNLQLFTISPCTLNLRTESLNFCAFNISTVVHKWKVSTSTAWKV